MIEERVEVISVASGYAFVKSLSSQACGQCSANKGCSKLAFTTPKPMLLKVHNPVYAKPGDIVIVGIPHGALVQSAVLVYLVPLLLLLTFSFIGHYLFSLMSFNAEMGSIGFGLLGLMLGIYTTRHPADDKAKKSTPTNHDPVILRQAPMTIDPINFKNHASYI